MTRPVVTVTGYDALPLLAQGKVRDMYDLGDRLLLISTDRISAFDYVLPAGIPDKGRVLTSLSAFWFDLTAGLAKNHVISTELGDLPEVLAERQNELEGRFMIVAKAEVYPVECIVRGYLAGSGFKEYNRSQSICGIELPAGLTESQRLPEPIFTPTTKAESGHDEPIDYGTFAKTVGEDTARELADKSIALYKKASEYAATRGIIIADTKLEWGSIDGEIILVDEIFTPDSSRFWPADEYEAGRSQNSFDKQFVRDYLESIQWDKQPPVPDLPEEIVSKTTEKYRMAYELLTGKPLE